MTTSAGEIKDVACVGYALGTFEADKGIEFISEKDSLKLTKVEMRLRLTMKQYSQDKPKIMKKLKDLMEITVNVPGDFLPQLTVLGLNFLMVTLKPNERKFRKLGVRLTSLWNDIGKDVEYLLNKYYDTQDENSAADSYTLVIKILERL